ncbi:MAG TPA: protease pro-enzyme activation domain-containing protein [Acidobacteriaceae bacterium]|nr:protease pro-enzyme activation domain-containing protein [Acidobacteriaceae bacterium]
MSSNRLLSRLCVLASVLTLGFTANGQTAALSAPRVVGPVNESRLAPLTNNTIALAQGRFDRGRVADGTPTGHMLMALRRSDAQQKALDALLGAQKDPKSPSYHKWLTPEQFGAQFGVADADVQAVTSYLAAQGFVVGRVFKNKMAIEFSGTTGQVRSAFRTEIHSFSVNGQTFHANVSAPQVPAALAPVVKGITLTNYRPPAAPVAQKLVLDRKTGVSHPLYADPINNLEAVSPGDLATIYDIPTTATGSGVTVGVISDSNINLAIPANYRTLFGLAAAAPTVVVDGMDPGINGDANLTYGEIELLAATAPLAQVNLYTAADTDLDTGVNFAIIRAIQDNEAQVLVFGFEGCEANLGPITNFLFAQAWQQAAAQGISVIVGAGTGGAAECDAALNGATPPAAATHGLAVNGYASTPYDTAVGASDFSYGTTGQASFWTTNGGTAGFTSAKGYIPEQPFNSSNQATNLNPFTPTVAQATGGGVSTVGLTADDLVTQSPYPQPSYQAAVAGGISTTARVVPDVSFFGGNFNGTNSNNGSTYILCIDPADCVDGTPDSLQYTPGNDSLLAASAFGGVAALVVQAHGPQGNLNDGLYATAAATPGAFHDITVGTNQVACTAGTGCAGGVTSGYNATAGYDAASGLGSVDVANLITGWKTGNGSGAPTTTLTFTKLGAPITSFAHDDPFVVLNVAVTGGAGTPTGIVAITSSATGRANQAVASVTLDNTGQGTYPGIAGLLPGGRYPVSGRYAGDANYAATVAQSAPITVSSVPGKLAMVTTDQSNNPLPVFNGQTVPYGTNVHFTFQVSDATDPNDPASATGAVTLTDSGVRVATLPLDSEGFASFSSSTVGAGAHVFGATYSGDSTFSAANLTGPGPSVNISGVATTTTLVLTDANPSVANSMVTLVATVTPNQVCAPLVPCPTGMAPGGKVRFKSVQTGGKGSTVLGTVTLAQGVNTGSAPSNTAVLTLPRNTFALNGTYTITATYLPDITTNYLTSSGSAAVAVGAGTGAVSTVTSIATTPAGATDFVDTSSVTLVASVSNTVARRATPTGNVTFFSNGAALGGVALDAAGIAGFVVPQTNGKMQLPLGQSNIVAQYFGDATHAPSSVNYVIHVYDATSTPDFAMQSATTFQTISAGNRAAHFTLQFTSMNDLAALGIPITLTSTPPAGITCSGAPVSPNFRKTIYATVNYTCRAATGVRIGEVTAPSTPRRFWMAEGGAALACVLLFGLPGRRRRWQTLMGSPALFVVAFGFTGCGATVASGPGQQYYDTINNSTGTPNASGALAPGTYTVIVTGTANVLTNPQLSTTANVVHNIPLTIVVQ